MKKNSAFTKVMAGILAGLMVFSVLVMGIICIIQAVAA